MVLGFRLPAEPSWTATEKSCVKSPSQGVSPQPRFQPLPQPARGSHWPASWKQYAIVRTPEAPGVLIATTPTPPVRHGIGVGDVQPWKSHKGKPRVVAGAKPTSFVGRWCAKTLQNNGVHFAPLSAMFGRRKWPGWRIEARNQCAAAPNDVRGTHRPAASCVVLCTRQASPLLMTMSPPLPSFGFALRHNLGQNPAANNGTYLERGESG